MLALQQRARISFVVDDLGVARALVGRDGARPASAPRCWSRSTSASIAAASTPDPATAVAFLQAVDALPGLRLRGILSHAGHAYHATRRTSCDDRRGRARRDGGSSSPRHAARSLPVLEVSAGATPPARYSLAVAAGTFTEFRPGNYVYLDRTMVGLGAGTRDDCALTVLATVVARRRPIASCSTAAARRSPPTASAASRRRRGHGDVYRNLVPDAGEQPDRHLHVERLSEEHATVRVAPGADALRPGDRVRVLPNHACVVSNLVDRAWLMDGGQVVSALPIAARGRIQ